MSKVVKSVGRAIGNVVKGVTKVVKSVASGVSKVFNSKIGKVILTAAAIYFGGAALMGAAGGASAGSGFLGTLSGAAQGAASGIASAWSGLTGAAGALIGGEGLGAAGSSLSGGLSGAYGAGSSAVANAASGAGAFTGATSTGLQTVAGDAANVLASGGGNGGLISGALGSMGDRSKAALIMSGAQLAGGVISGAGQQKALSEQRDYEAQQAQLARDRYNLNVGTPLWGSAPTFGNVSNTNAAPNYDPLEEAQMISAIRRAEFEARYPANPTTGLIAQGMQPAIGNTPPVYKPYYRG